MLMKFFHMDRVTRRWLTQAPQLLTAYLVWVNRGGAAARRACTVGMTLFIAWTLAASVYFQTDRAAALATLAWVQGHILFLGGISAFAAGILVSRRRVLNKIAASRSWTAALPTKRSTAKWQAIAIESSPALTIVGLLAAAFGGLSVIVHFQADTPAPISAWGAMTGGVVLGTALSYLMPAPKEAELYEGSRYVPHRRRAATPIPTGSLSALGSWPVRQMFASARPKAVARASLPIIVLMPMGSTADVAMLVMGLFVAVGALVLLGTSVISVSAKAARWLQPVPVGSGLLARRLLMRTLAVMFCVTVAGSWLLWVLGTPVDRCIAGGALTLIGGSVLAVSGSLVTIAGKRRGGR
jgi:hypothetical protein